MILSPEKIFWYYFSPPSDQDFEKKIGWGWSIIQNKKEELISIKIQNFSKYLSGNRFKNLDFLKEDFSYFKIMLCNLKISIEQEKLNQFENDLVEAIWNCYFNCNQQKMEKCIIEKDKLTSFLYDLLRDHLPAGVVEKLVQNALAENGSVEYTNGYLAQYAQNLANRLR